MQCSYTYVKTGAQDVHRVLGAGVFVALWTTLSAHRAMGRELQFLHTCVGSDSEQCCPLGGGLSRRLNNNSARLLTAVCKAEDVSEATSG